VEWVLLTTPSGDGSVDGGSWQPRLDRLSARVGFVPTHHLPHDSSSLRLLPPVPPPSLVMDGPSKQPFLRASGPPGTDLDWPPPTAVTICLQLDTRRLAQLHARAANYQGPIAAVILVLDENRELPLIKAAWAGSEPLRRWVDIHLYSMDRRGGGEVSAVDRGVMPHGKVMYPVQALRNMAIEASRTDWVMTAEVRWHTLLDPPLGASSSYCFLG